VFKIKNYKMGFDIWGFLLFLTIMLPNFIWFAVPAVHDVLRNPSTTPVIDGIASVFQVVMVLSLCIIINKERQKPMKRALLKGITVLIILYYAGWCLYYGGSINPSVILDLCIAPCLTFILFSISRKNILALISSGIFMLCHLLYGVLNFILLGK